MHYFVKERICCIVKPTWIIEDYESWEQKIQIPLGLRLDEELATLRKTPTTDNNWTMVSLSVLCVWLYFLLLVSTHAYIFYFIKKKNTDFTLHPFLWEGEVPFEQKFIGKSVWLCIKVQSHKNCGADQHEDMKGYCQWLTCMGILFNRVGSNATSSRRYWIQGPRIKGRKRKRKLWHCSTNRCWN